ncbi:MAG TPA: hypothetical protein VMV94_00245, partial [Phycisphaerae bacterium]|nr:hypothetical protein [Phycisphaerae bacterium]
RFVVLCEDDEHSRFAHHTLRKLGRQYRELRILVCPSGREAADNWVRKHYPEEVALHRRKASSQEGLALIVLIDADRLSVDQRHEQLGEALRSSNLAERGPSEKVVIWVPKRHIETWIAELLHGDANEEDDYKNAMRGADYQTAAQRFVEHVRNAGNYPSGLLPSMSRALDETARLPQ